MYCWEYFHRYFTWIITSEFFIKLDVKLGGIIEIYEKFTGDDPRKVPMKIFPAVHYSMGGLYVELAPKRLPPC
jgi:succinate dehydrogenase/fumarate reductase flavoprotein subunit